MMEKWTIKTYLDFVLAMENRHEPQSLQYLFRILDINNKGYLDTFCLNYFFRAIQEQMTMHGQEPVPFEDVKDEIFDMVRPADPYRITLKDLLNCGQGDTMISILIDLNGFGLMKIVKQWQLTQVKHLQKYDIQLRGTSEYLILN
ncbi:hypothetical protein L9F63_017305 [Diploptera punctata]|uniref:Serine/threonine-protein phosphatase 2A regulatory subunit B'' subunit gamma n=1 Tax=Diploptera punctata TaxID=6984 RepID=A0AAD7ZZ85_DIPPU|nr:hypothetical protein L9F63_017305 [Diploptera punctata]